MTPRISNEDYAALGALLSEIRSVADELAALLARVEHEGPAAPPATIRGGQATAEPQA
jgi:hypothetical protein